MEQNDDGITTTTTDSTTVTDALRIAAPIAGLVLFVGIFWYAATMVNNLFAQRLGAPAEAWLAVTASVGVVLGTLLITLASDKHSVRGLAGLYLFVWILLTLCLVALEAAARGGILAVPQSLASVGQVIAALLAAIALVPAITIPLVSMHPDHYPSSAAAIGSYVFLVAKGVAIAASVFASAYFGLSRGMPVEVAVLCGFVIESCFIASYLSLIKAVQNRDAFDMTLWALAVVAFGCFIALISVETISTLSHIDVPLLRPLRDAGATLFASAVGLALFLTIIMAVATSLINIPLRSRSIPRPDIVERPRLRRLGDRMADLRGDAGYFVGKVRGRQLPESQYVPLSKSELEAAEERGRYRALFELAARNQQGKTDPKA